MMRAHRDRIVAQAAGRATGTSMDITERREAHARERAADHALALLQYALDQAVILAITDVKGRITYANEKFCVISGYAREELLGQDHRVLNSGRHCKEFFRDMYRTIARGAVWRGELCNRAKDGSHYWVDTTIVSRPDARGKPVAYLAINVDITARKAAEAAKIASEGRARQKSAQLEATLANMTQGLCMFDAAQRVVVCNKKYAEMYGLAPDEVKPGTTLRAIVSRRIEEGIYAGTDPDEYLRERLAPVTQPSHEIQQMSDGRAIAILRQPMADGGWVTTHTDITERRRADAQIAYMARHDALTGLANRVLFQEKSEQALMRLQQGGERFAAFMLDLDRFKDVNDSLGHPVGDALLKAVTRRLRTCTRDTDIVARFGGDEFAILQTTDSNQKESAIILANRLLENITAPYDLDGHKVIVGTSIGIAMAPDHGTRADELLRNADLALYRVKSNGRNGYRFFEREMETEAWSRRILEAELREAISRHEFELYYQPVIHSATRQLAGAEALIRWRHPVRGIVGPDDFIPLAEETGLIAELGEWVLRTACTEAARWAPHLSVAVNLSAAQFRKSNLVDVVATAIRDSGLAPERIELEITESVLLQKSAENIGLLHQLRSLGPRIVLDDFGTGFSSLSYVQAFPFDKIKIDKSFVNEISSRPTCAAIVCAVTGLARSLNIVTTAEGVETEEQFELLIAAGCNQAQGYLFGQPRPACELNFADVESRAIKAKSA
jgi:diguanylate cyclase (GGDEF)-like protein/PAS domain S-box-containing protein